MVGALFLVTDKIYDCEGSSLHVSLFIGQLKSTLLKEDSQARQAATVGHFILSWTMELWDLKALNATLEGK